jgi:hypothetical protein
MEQQLSPEQRDQLRDMFTEALKLHSESYHHLMEHNLTGYDAARDDLFVVRMKFDRLVGSL